MENTMTNVNITAGTHLNLPVAGTFELVQDFVAWGGTVGVRRVGTNGAGYIKVYGADFRGDVRKFKVTVPGADNGYTVVVEASAEVAAVEAEIAELVAILANETGPSRAKYRKRLNRRTAKLAELA
jgi:hypothetical protein